MNLIQFKNESASGTGVYSTNITEKPTSGAYALTDMVMSLPTNVDDPKVWDNMVGIALGYYGLELENEDAFLIGKRDHKTMSVQVAIHFDDLQVAIKYAIMNDLQIYSEEHGNIFVPSSQVGTMTQKQTYADMTSRLMATRLIHHANE
jgi:hypothetical protein